MVSIPHFQIPFQVDPVTQHIAVVEQGTEDDVRQCIQALVTTEIGSRAELPEYGIPSILFVETIDASGILAAVLRWEPRAQLMISDAPDAQDEFIRWITVDVMGGNG